MINQYLNCSISVQLVHCTDDDVDLVSLPAPTVVEERCTSAVGRGFSEMRELPNNVISAAVVSSIDPVPVDKRLIPYCKATVSSEWTGALHVPDPTHTFFSTRIASSASLPLVADSFVATACNRLTVLARWSQCAMGPHHAPSQTVARSTRPFLHGRRHIAPPHFSKNLPVTCGDLDRHLIHDSLDSPDPLPENGNLMESAVFSESMVVTNRRTNGHTDRPAERTRNSVATNRPLTLYVRRGLIILD